MKAKLGLLEIQTLFVVPDEFYKIRKNPTLFKRSISVSGAGLIFTGGTGLSQGNVWTPEAFGANS